MSKSTLDESRHAKKDWRELGGENLTRRSFEKILRRASRPLPLTPEDDTTEG